MEILQELEHTTPGSTKADFFLSVWLVARKGTTGPEMRLWKRACGNCKGMSELVPLQLLVSASHNFFRPSGEKRTPNFFRRKGAASEPCAVRAARAAGLAWAESVLGVAASEPSLSAQCVLRRCALIFLCSVILLALCQ